jgi:hypothetical protein
MQDWWIISRVCVIVQMLITCFMQVRPSLRPSVRLSVRPSICLSVRLSVHPSVRLSVCPSVRPSVCPPVRPSVCPSVRLSVRPSVCLSVRPSVCLSVCLSACISAAPTGQISVKFDHGYFFIEICWEIPNLVIIGQKIWHFTCRPKYAFFPPTILNRHKGALYGWSGIRMLQ